MSNRTRLADKAVRSKWEKEQELIREGKGTRDWTPEQQKDILERGRAYDENGKTFEGHHMMSVEAYPEYQGESGNIQLLSWEEHFNAHNRNFQNPTHGFFNPITGETLLFTSDKFVPCEVIKLSTPIHNKGSEESIEPESPPPEKKEAPHKNIEPPPVRTDSPPKASTSTDVISEKSVHKSEKASNRLSQFWTKTKRAGKQAGKWIVERPFIKWVVAHPGESLAIGAALGKAGYNCYNFVNEIVKRRNGYSGGGESVSSYSSSDDLSASNYSYGYDLSEDEVLNNEDSVSEQAFDEEESDDKQGTPKRPHERRGYPGYRWKGKGENKRLEETWIKPTRIHKEDFDDYFDSQ